MIEISPFKNWIMFKFYNYRLSLAKGKHTNKRFNYWKSPLHFKHTFDTRFFGIILTRNK
jgi:hypothetical protein